MVLLVDSGEVPVLEWRVGHGVEEAHHAAPWPMPVILRQFEEGGGVSMIVCPKLFADPMLDSHLWGIECGWIRRGGLC